jgi:protein-S-isoprenylcysteine O-methyltransferase Ste14
VPASGTYGSGANLAFALLVSALALAGHLWHHGRGARWPELVWLAGALGQLLIRWPFLKSNRANRIMDRRVNLQEKLLLGGVFATMVVLPMLHVGTPLLDAFDYPLPNAAPWLGAALLVPASWLFWRSHADLGRNWSPSLEVREGHNIVDTGVYARIRHPMYAAIWLYAAAQVLLIPNWIAGALVMPAFTALYGLRVPKEEQMMLETFGKPYRDYMQRTGRVLPRYTQKDSP